MRPDDDCADNPQSTERFHLIARYLVPVSESKLNNPPNVMAPEEFNVALNGTDSFEFVPLNSAHALPDFPGTNAMFAAEASKPLPEESRESPLNFNFSDAPKYSPIVAFG